MSNWSYENNSYLFANTENYYKYFNYKKMTLILKKKKQEITWIEEKIGKLGFEEVILVFVRNNHDEGLIIETDLWSCSDTMSKSCS